MRRTDYNLPIFDDIDVADLNAYTEDLADKLKVQIDRFGNPLTFRGVVATLNDLPENAAAGDIYGVIEMNKNYVYSGLEWLEYSETIAIEKNNVEVHFLYRGDNQGDCILIKTKNKNILIDLGKTNSSILIDKLQEKNIEKIDYIIISHFHGDHVMGYTENYDASNWTALFNSNIDFSECTCIFPKTPDWTKFIYGDTADSTNRDIAGATYLPTLETNITNVVTNAGLTIVRPNDLSVIEIDEETSLKFLNCNENNFTDYYDVVEYNPSFEKYMTCYNNFSLVVELTHAKHKFLFTGDAQEKAQEKIADNISYCDVYKVEHHGGNATVNKKFYQKISPKIAIIMNTGTTNKNNPMQVGLKLRGTEIYTSNESHDIVVKSTKDGIFTVSDNGRSDFKANIGRALEINDFTSVYTLEVFGKEIKEGDNLDDYTIAGVFYSNNSEITQSLSNCPVTRNGFKLIVEYSQATNRIIQTIKCNDRASSKSYVRTNVDQWGAWNKVIKEQTLFESSEGTNEDITLSKPYTVFDEIEIFYSVAGYNKSVKVPVRVTTNLRAILDFMYAGTQNIVTGTETITFNGSTLKRGTVAAKNINIANNTISTNSNIEILIHKVTVF